MTFDEFKTSLNASSPPAGLSLLLQAMWYEANGDWNRAHELAQDVDTFDGSWIHGYLHLREGDRSNARYWYEHCNQSLPSTTLDEEWERIVKELL